MMINSNRTHATTTPTGYCPPLEIMLADAQVSKCDGSRSCEMSPALEQNHADNISPHRPDEGSDHRDPTDDMRHMRDASNLPQLWDTQEMNNPMNNDDIEVSSPAQEIRLADLQTSKWNRSWGMSISPVYLKTLADDIKKNAILNPIILVREMNSKALQILAGVHRWEALKSIRGEDGCLHVGEYRIIDVDSTDVRCLAISVADNSYHHEQSVYDLATYVMRIESECHSNQDKIAEILKLTRPKVNRLSLLVKNWDPLPESVKADFQKAPSFSHDDREGPNFKFSHWYEFAALVEKIGMTDEMSNMLEMALKNRWSTRQIKKAVQKHNVANGNGSAQLAVEDTVGNEISQTVAKPAKRIKPVVAYAKAIMAIRKASDYVRECKELADACGQLEAIAASIDQKLQLMKENTEELFCTQRPRNRTPGRNARGYPAASANVWIPPCP